MKLIVTTTLAAMAMIAGSAVFADALHYKDLYDPKLHAPRAVSHGGVAAATKAQVETAAAPDAPEFNAHVALWRSFDVPAAVNGTQPAGINLCAKPAARS